MKYYSSLLAVLSFAIADIVEAHAHLEKSQPAANSTVSVLPKNIVLEFNEAVQLTALTLQMSDGVKQDVGPLPKTAAKEVMVPMPAVMTGTYIIQWRAVGDDNHATSGKVSFTVAAKSVQ